MICSLAVTNNELNDSLAKFWETEQEPNITHYSPDERACEAHFIETHGRDESGRFVVRLPFKVDEVQLGRSFQGALQRFYGTERRLNKNPNLKLKYVEFMREYERLGHTQKLHGFPINGESNCYVIPHHAVFKDEKIRVVFDASYKTELGISLNDILHTGPTIQNDLFSMLLSFRKHKYVLSCDMIKMFRQILVNENDRCFQRILWRYDDSEPLSCYELTTVVFGMTSSPYLAIRCLHQLANIWENIYPDMAHIIKNQIYVDDVLCGAPEIAEVLTIESKLKEIFKSAGFELSKFKTNFNHSAGTDPGIVHLSKYSDSKTLGISWDARNDQLYYIYNPVFSNVITKRGVLSEIAQLFDPLGMLGPVVATAKLFVQTLWQEKLSWDDPLPHQLQVDWLKFREQLSALNKITIPRYILAHTSSIQLHGFADASEKCYGCCIYVRSSKGCDDRSVHLLCARSKIAPLKVVSLPRLELCAALLLAKLMRSVERAMNISIQRRYLWSDSTITLHWIKESPHKWKTYVANRVSAIQDLTDVRELRHIRSVDNPADVISRGSFPRALVTMEDW